MKICLVQSIYEIEKIKDQLEFLPVVIPLSLETLIYCDSKKINYLDPEKIIGKIFFEKANHCCSEFLEKLDLNTINYDFIKNEIKSIIRFKFNQVAFLIEIIENIRKQQKISEIFITNQYTSEKYEVMTVYPGNNFTNIENILLDIYNNNEIKILNINEKENLIKKNIFFKYKIDGLRYKNKKKILFNNSGYNFRRLIIYILKKGRKISFFNEGIPYFKKVIFKIMGIEIIDFKKIKNFHQNKNFNLNINCIFKNFDISKLLRLQLIKSSNYLTDLENKYEALSEFFDSSEIDLVISNSNRGYGGMIIESALRKKIKNLMISHGTIAKSFNRNDDIYKKIIAEGVFSGKTDFHAIQSKITEDSLKTHKVIGKPLITGNLVFAEKKNFSKKKKFKCIYAVTNKPFAAMQFFGLEMYYEFFNNLKNLENFSNSYNYDFCIHLHPGAKNSMSLLQKRFKNLTFTTGRIEKSLNDASVTLSYSSTVIEDSLHCKVPVILFDSRYRYKHCESELDPNKKNKSIYYINNNENLAKCLDTIKASKNIDFEEHIFLKESKENIKKLFSDLMI